MNSDERAARRLFLRVARVLIGCVILVVGAGAALWLRAAFYPWTDAGNPDVRAPHVVLHIVNESGVPLSLAWRCAPIAASGSDAPIATSGAGTPPRPPAPWIDLPPPPGAVPGIVETAGFRLLAPVHDEAPPAPSLPVASAPAGPRVPACIELRVSLGDDTLLGNFVARSGQHARLRIDGRRQPHLATGDASWLGAPSFGTEQPLTGAQPAPGTSISPRR